MEKRIPADLPKDLNGRHFIVVTIEVIKNRLFCLGRTISNEYLDTRS